jgi:hypothetical protein
MLPLPRRFQIESAEGRRRGGMVPLATRRLQMTIICPGCWGSLPGGE